MKANILAFFVGFALSLSATERASPGTISYTKFLDEVRSGDIARVAILGQSATISMKNGATATTVLPSDYRDVLSELHDRRVDVEIHESSSLSIVNAAPFLVLGGLWLVLLVKLKFR